MIGDDDQGCLKISFRVWSGKDSGLANCLLVTMSIKV